MTKLETNEAVKSKSFNHGNSRRGRDRVAVCEIGEAREKENEEKLKKKKKKIT